MSEITTAKPVPLLDDEGALSDAFYAVLRTVFSKFAALDLPPAPPTKGATETDELEDREEGQECLTRARLNEFAKSTNGKPMDDETFVEVYEFFNCVAAEENGTKVPALTFKGFTQLYELQTGADEAESRNDLKSWGYNEQLELVSPAKETKETVAEAESKEAEKESAGSEKAEEAPVETIESSYA